MALSTLVVPAASQNVRVARLVVGAAASRAGMDPDLIDDVRLAVGEAVGQAVVAAADPLTTSVEIRISEGGGRFSVEVHDPTSRDDLGDDPGEGFAMAVIAGLAPEVEVRPDPAGGRTVRMAWVV